MQVHHKFEISFVYSSEGKEKNLLFVAYKALSESSMC